MMWHTAPFGNHAGMGSLLRLDDSRVCCGSVRRLAVIVSMLIHWRQASSLQFWGRAFNDIYYRFWLCTMQLVVYFRV